MYVIDVGMPLLLANHQTSIVAAQVACGMLLDYNNFYVMNRLNAEDEHDRKYLDELSPHKTTDDAKKLSFMDEPKAVTSVESFSYQQLCDTYYHNQIQNKQMLQQVDGDGATTTPLQHLNNIFGLKVPSTTLYSSGLSLSGMLDANSLQYFNAAMQSERQQYEKIFKELYGGRAPQLSNCNTDGHLQQDQEQADVMATDLQGQLIQAPKMIAPSTSSTFLPSAITTTMSGTKDSALSALIFEGDMCNSSMNIISSRHAALLAATGNEITHAAPKLPAATTNTSTIATVAGKSKTKARAQAAVAEKSEMVAVEAATTIQPSAISSQNKQSTKGMQNFNG